MIVRQVAPSSWDESTAWKCPRILRSQLHEFGTPTKCFESRVLEDPPSGDAMCLHYRRLIQRLIAEAR